MAPAFRRQMWPILPKRLGRAVRPTVAPRRANQVPREHSCQMSKPLEIEFAPLTAAPKAVSAVFATHDLGFGKSLEALNA